MELLTIQDVAARLKISTRTAHKLRAEGHPYLSGKSAKIGNLVRYKAHELDAYIEQLPHDRDE
jgi:excisionase family DNA binding protein